LDPLAVIVLYLFGIYHNYLPHSSRRHRLYPWCSSDPGCPRLYAASHVNGTPR